VVSCERCGAHLELTALSCPYCGSGTAYAAQQHEQATAYQRQRSLYEQQQVAERKAHNRQTLERMTRQSLIWSALGLATCCVPIFSIVGGVLSLRAWNLAQAEGLAKPARATVALMLALGSIGLSGLCWIGMFWIQAEETAAKERLIQEIGDAPRASVLGPSIACKMTELEIIRTKFEKYSQLNDEFVCSANLATQGQRAVLLDCKIGREKADLPVFACFKRGADRWYVSQLRADANCPE
jgi:hypothetical protein